MLIFFEKISTQNMLFIIKSPCLFCIARLLQLINLKSTLKYMGPGKGKEALVRSWLHPFLGVVPSVKMLELCQATVVTMQCIPTPTTYLGTSLLLSEPPGPLHEKDPTYLNSFKSRSCSMAYLA